MSEQQQQDAQHDEEEFQKELALHKKRVELLTYSSSEYRKLIVEKIERNARENILKEAVLQEASKSYKALIEMYARIFEISKSMRVGDVQYIDLTHIQPQHRRVLEKDIRSVRSLSAIFTNKEELPGAPPDSCELKLRLY